MNLTDTIYEWVIKRLTEASNLSGGPLRSTMGSLVENMIDLIWEELQKKYPNVDSKITIGSNNPVKIFYDNEGYIEESVDRHCYINNQLVLAIECKTYLDKCYMQRADSDFQLMKIEKPFDAIIVSIENGISDNAFNFFLKRQHVDDVYYLAEGKRNSSRNKHISKNTDRIKKDYIENLINKIESYFLI